MKKFKAMTIILISVIISFSTLFTANAVNSESDNYKILIENGFTANYINGLTDSMINKMAAQIRKVSDPEYVSDYDFLLFLGFPEEFLKDVSKTALNKIRENLDDNNISRLDYKTQSATNSNDVLIKKLSVQLTEKSDKSVVGETVCIYWEWPANKPLIRDEDLISVSWNRDIFCYESDSFYSEDYRRNTIEDTWTVSDSYSNLARLSLDSIGHWTKLYTTKKQVGGFMIFTLSPTKPIDSDSDYDRNINIDYTYKTESVTTVALCIAFILLVLSALSIITKIIKRKKK